MENKKPLVSVIMGVHNEEKFIEKSIESLQKQTYPEIETIIIDDKSQDHTPEILQKHAEKDPRIKVTRNQKNQGLTRSLNKGIKKAKGKYIARIDAGDRALPERIEKQVEHMEKNPETSILGTSAHWINEKGEKIGKWEVPEKINAEKVYEKGGLIHPSLLIRKKLFEEIGLYDPEYYVSQDYELYLRALSQRKIIKNLGEKLNEIMYRKKGISMAKIRKSQITRFKIKTRYLTKFPGIKNILYTLRSLLGILMPARELEKIARKNIKN